MKVSAERRLVMCVDIEGYSARSDYGQLHLQRLFPGIMDEAADHCGLDRRAWSIQSRGDGELVVFPADVSEPDIVADLAPALERVLRERASFASAAARVRMRMAVHQGNVLRQHGGFAGSAVVKVCRLVDANALHHALEQFPDAPVASIVSAEIYDEVVRQSYPGIRAELYRPVSVSVKSFTETAYVFVPGEDVNHAPDARGAMPAHPRTPAGASPATAGSGPAQPAATGGGSHTHIDTMTNSGWSIIGDHGSISGSP